jgi:hypothetical protein
MQAMYDEMFRTLRVDQNRMIMFRDELEMERLRNRNINIITDEYELLKRRYAEISDEISDLILMLNDIPNNTNQHAHNLVTLIQWEATFRTMMEEINQNYEFILKKKRMKYHVRSLKNRTGHYKNKNKNNKNKNNKTHRNIRNILPALNRSNVFSSYL